jgi:hypothetical protein
LALNTTPFAGENEKGTGSDKGGGATWAPTFATHCVKNRPGYLSIRSSLRYPGDPRGEIADVLLSRLQGDPAREIEALIAEVRSG